MPAPKKLDLIPDALRERLKAALMARGFADVIKVTEELNVWLEAEGLELRIGKTAVGEFSLLLKRQRDAFSVSKQVLSEMEIGEESAIYQTLFQLVAAQAVHLVKAMSDADQVIEAKDLHFLGKMLKDLMSAAGINEKLTQEVEKRLKAKQAEQLTAAVASGDIDAEAAAKARRIMGFAE
ncbi:MAG: DUF3486 family protein [Tabrizicola sp.]|jgi:hypothetical protein|nr:DUF3486 family protein [Tabrizicola sp.]